MTPFKQFFPAVLKILTPTYTKKLSFDFFCRYFTLKDVSSQKFLTAVSSESQQVKGKS